MLPASSRNKRQFKFITMTRIIQMKTETQKCKSMLRLAQSNKKSETHKPTQ